MAITQQQINQAQTLQHTAAHSNTMQTRLIAGPGTGKSYAIEERVRHLLNNVDPRNIFVLSFTRLSAKELKNRIFNYCQNHGIDHAIFSHLNVSTLHSLALRLLKSAGLLTNYPVDPKVLDEWEQENIFDYEYSIDNNCNKNRSEDIRKTHEAFWSTGTWNPANYISPNPPVSVNEITRFNSFHNIRTQLYSCVLQGELIRQCVDRINSGTLNPLSYLPISYLIVDEYQDLNPCDLEFINILIQKGVNAFIAGDDDQSIYSFRFASPSGIQNFHNQYPTASLYNLNDCFRCTPSIVYVSQNLINHNSPPNRIPKNLNSLYLNSIPPVTGSVFTWCFNNGYEESSAIAQSCENLINVGIKPNDILILLNNRRILGSPIIHEFQTRNINFYYDGNNIFIDNEAGRMIYSILGLVINNDNYIALRTILGLTRGVGKSTLVGIINKIILNNLNYKNIFNNPLPNGVFNNRETTLINLIRQTLIIISGWTVSSTLSTINTEMLNIIDSLNRNYHDDWISFSNNLPTDIQLSEIIDLMNFESTEIENQILDNVYNRIGVIPTPPNLNSINGVKIMSMHKAKGLSAAVVFIPGLEEDIIPGPYRNPYPGLILESARLLYVSITRAKVSCIMSYSSNRYVFGRNIRHIASRFNQNLGNLFTHRTHGFTNVEATNIFNDLSNL